MTDIRGIGPKSEHRQVISTIEAMRRRVSEVSGVMATDTFALNTSGTTTDRSDSAVTATSTVLLQAADAGGASIDGVCGSYVSSVSDGSFTVTHPASPVTRTVRYFVIG